MSWFGWLTGKESPVEKIVDKLAKGADELHFSGEEKAEKQAEFELEVTKRWVADSQAPITRLVRPVSYLFVTAVVFIFGALDSSLEGFKISDAWLTTFTQIYITMTVAYFGGRSYEKAKAK